MMVGCLSLRAGERTVLTEQYVRLLLVHKCYSTYYTVLSVLCTIELRTYVVDTHAAYRKVGILVPGYMEINPSFFP